MVVCTSSLWREAQEIVLLNLQKKKKKKNLTVLPYTLRCHMHFLPFYWQFCDKHICKFQYNKDTFKSRIYT